MSEFKNKNDYSVTVFSATGFLIKISFANDMYKLSKWLDESKFKEWHYMNVYARRTNRYICRIYKGKFIVAKPK